MIKLDTLHPDYEMLYTNLDVLYCQAIYSVSKVIYWDCKADIHKVNIVKDVAKLKSVQNRKFFWCLLLE